MEGALAYPLSIFQTLELMEERDLSLLRSLATVVWELKGSLSSGAYCSSLSSSVVEIDPLSPEKGFKEIADLLKRVGDGVGQSFAEEI